MADLLPILDSLGSPTSPGQRPVLLGHSFGGFLAWQLAGVAPERIAALILVDPAIAVSAETARNGQSYENSIVGHSWPDDDAALAELVAARPPSGWWAAALDAALATQRGPDGRVRHVVAADAVTACWEQLQQPHRPNGYAGPVLLLEAGREDGRYIGGPVIAQMREQIGDRFTHVVLDATHTIPSDYPDELAREVGGFIASL